jgi:uncharacterized protein (TIGR03437 family)
MNKGLFLLLPGVLAAQSGVLSTVAGNGTPGDSGDGDPAVSASLRFLPTRQVPDEPDISELDRYMQIWVDAGSNLWISDYSNHRVRRVTPAGVITTVAGTGTRGYSGDGGPARSAALWGPAAVAVDPRDGAAYLADQQNNRLRRVGPDGVITTVAGNGQHLLYRAGEIATASPMDWPSGLAIDSAGTIYFSEVHSNRIARIAGNRIVTVAGDGFEGMTGDGGPAASARLRFPAGLAFDGRGNLYIADQRNHRVRRIAPDGTMTTAAGTGNGRNTGGYGGDGGPATSAQLNNPVAVAVDAAGNLYIADMLNHRIRRVAPNGTITTVAGNGRPGFSGDGGPAASGQLNFPAGVAVDPSGNLYIADWQNYRVRKVTFGPVVTGITNAASYAPADVVGAAPGSWISVFGSGLAAGEAVAAEIPLPQRLGSTVVKVNGAAIPLNYVSPGQINAQAPVELSSGVATLVVETASGATQPVTFQVAAAGPGVFVWGENRAVATHADGRLITAESPAEAGETIIVYLTGAGAVAPPVATGTAAGVSPLSRATLPSSAAIGGRSAALDFLGMTPYLVALSQANLRVPEGLSAGDHPVVITVGGAVSNAPLVRVR